MRDIQWEAETDLETIYYVGSTSQNLHYPMPPLTCLVLWSCWCWFDFSPLCACQMSCSVAVVLVLVALVVSLACGQSVHHLMNCHRSGEDLGRSKSYLILWTPPRALPLPQMIGMAAEKMVMIRAAQQEYET